jgi:2-polyprenyl-6-methoxyphenol hydroxylase-like FAD-dependent oxidoreductase
VLVVGAGPTGLALALQAHDHGARVRVVERRARCFRPSRALILHPRTLEVLRPLGVTDALLAHGDVAPAVRLHLGGKEIPARLGDFAIGDTAFPYLVFAPQTVVEGVLSEALAVRGVEVERGVDLVDVRPEGAGVVARLRRTGTDLVVGCRYVAGCDGPSSTVRRRAAVGWRGAPYRQEVVLADVELDGELAPTAHAVAGRDGVLFLFALGESATWRVLATRPAEAILRPACQPLGQISREELQSLIDRAGLQLRIADLAWSAHVPLQHRIADRFRAGPLFLLGDAAHVHSPAGGQGMNAGIQDATNLGWKLAFAASTQALTGPGAPGLLDSYEAERRPIARRVLALTHALFWAEAGTDPLASFVRRAVVPTATPVLPFLLRRRRLIAGGVRVLSQLAVQYRSSPLSREGSPPGGHGSHPGERLPDGLVSVEGRRWHLHELLACPGVHVLLECEAPQLDLSSPAASIRVLRIADWAGRGVVVVRPDGYVGYRCAIADPVQIGDWLAMIGVSSEKATRESRSWKVASASVSSRRIGGTCPIR